jgi:TetR/AcrR family transcriptional repressor of nem operon
MTIVMIVAIMSIVMYVVNTKVCRGGAPVKVSREQVAENRRRILTAASKLFREKGFDGVGVDAVMQSAGLTHGAFYGHFQSKEDLVAHACSHALADTDESWRSSSDPLRALAALYLNAEHCKNPGGGCLLAALGPDVARQSGAARRAFADALRIRIDSLAKLHAGSSAVQRREKAIATWAGLVGAMILARAVDDPALADEILKAGVAVFGDKRAVANRSASPRKKVPRRRTRS